MLLTITRKSTNGNAATVWEFQFHPGATELDRFKLEVISYTKYKLTKAPAEWRSVGRWALGWNCTLPWTEIRLPQDVYDEVRSKIAERLNYMMIRAGNHPLQVSLQQQEKDQHDMD